VPGARCRAGFRPHADPGFPLSAPSSGAGKINAEVTGRLTESLTACCHQGYHAEARKRACSAKASAPSRQRAEKHDRMSLMSLSARADGPRRAIVMYLGARTCWHTKCRWAITWNSHGAGLYDSPVVSVVNIGTQISEVWRLERTRRSWPNAREKDLPAPSLSAPSARSRLRPGHFAYNPSATCSTASRLPPSRHVTQFVVLRFPAIHTIGLISAFYKRLRTNSGGWLTSIASNSRASAASSASFCRRLSCSWLIRDNVVSPGPTPAKKTSSQPVKSRALTNSPRSSTKVQHHRGERASNFPAASAAPLHRAPSWPTANSDPR